MAVNIAPIGRQQFFDANGDPLSGGKLHTYAAGTTSNETTYTDSTGNTANANPIILDSNGYAPNGIWLTAGTSYKFVLKTSADVEVWTEDNIDGVNDVSSPTVDEWLASGQTPTFVSTTSFTMPGDQTTEFMVGRRLKFTVSAGTVYGTIATSAYTTLTTVTMTMDGSDVLDSGLSVVAYGILRASNSSWPHILTTTLDANSNMLLLSKGADVASANALALGTDGNFFDITGTTSITSIDTVGVGTQVVLQFDGILTFTHHATNLILPNNGNDITTAAGDIAFLTEYASGDWICTSYVRASGAPIAPGWQQTMTAQGTKSSGTFTPEPSDGHMQSATNGGAHTLAPPTEVGQFILIYTNNASAGAITTSGFSKVLGDSFTTTNGDIFECLITYDGTTSVLQVTDIT